MRKFNVQVIVGVCGGNGGRRLWVWACNAYFGYGAAKTGAGVLVTVDAWLEKNVTGRRRVEGVDGTQHWGKGDEFKTEIVLNSKCELRARGRCCSTDECVCVHKKARERESERVLIPGENRAGNIKRPPAMLNWCVYFECGILKTSGTNWLVRRWSPWTSHVCHHKHRSCIYIHPTNMKRKLLPFGRGKNNYSIERANRFDLLDNCKSNR